MCRYAGRVSKDARQDLIAANESYRATESAHEDARRRVVAAVVAALRAGIAPTEVSGLSPFTATYVRRIARENGIPPAAPGPKRTVGT